MAAGPESFDSASVSGELCCSNQTDSGHDQECEPDDEAHACRSEQRHDSAFGDERSTDGADEQEAGTDGGQAG